MDRQRGDGHPKTTNDIAREQAGRPVGERHVERDGTDDKTKGRIRGGGDPLDAVRDVVNQEKD
jgi:hypothetical protein